MARVTTARTRQAILKPDAELAPDIVPEYIALFDEEGNPIALSAASGVPALGEPDQVLTKNSDDDYDMEWRDVPPGIPAGGATGELLTKDSGADYDAIWAPAPPGVLVLRKVVSGSVAIPSGTAVDDITLTITLTETRLVQLFGRAGHSDPPSSHTFDWCLNGVQLAAGGNNSSSVNHYAISGGAGSSSMPVVSSIVSGQPVQLMASGIPVVLAAGTHTFKHRTTRGSSGGTMQDRLLMAVILDADIVDQ